MLGSCHRKRAVTTMDATAKERAERLDMLKRKKADNKKEKEAIMRALEEDKLEREQRAQQKKVVQEEQASTAGEARHTF